MRRFLIVLLLLYASGLPAANDRALFWKVQAGGSVCYLLGSMHVADSSFYPLRAKIDRAFENADYLVVEIDTARLRPGEFNRVVERRGVYAGDKTIRDEISTQTWQLLQQQLRELGLPLDWAEKQKPGLLVLTLSSLQWASLGYDPMLGIDMHFLQRAQDGKPILELETVEEQLSIFLDFPDGDLLLREMLHSMDDTEAMMDDLVRYWKRGDAEKLEYLMFEEAVEKYPVFASVYDRLIDDRNVRIADKLATWLQRREGVYFVVVGAGHLVGENAIPALLAQKGYRVERE